VNLAGANSSNSQTKAVVIIPARFESLRLPGKALLEIAGKPMICWVAERARSARNVARLIVATDDQRILAAVEAAGFEAVLTRKDHASGTDRIAEVAATLDDAEIIVNVQGDEPLISPATIERAVEAMAENGGTDGDRGRRGDRETGRQGDGEKRPVGGAEKRGRRDGLEWGEEDEGAGIVTTWEAIHSAADVLNSDVVKVVVDDKGQALYFSRSPVPYPRDAVRKYGTIEAALDKQPELLNRFRKHTGLYVYRRNVLLEFTRWPQSELERIESLEQLRALEHGVKIKAIEASTPSIGVDTWEDIERVREIVSSFEFQVSSSLG
jgi:3-deoxy-manno-octulosonate cytidylyltransferase (CMP-KDO synthetase)